MKKGIRLAAAVVLSLCLCWYIGQQMKQAREAKQDMPEGQEQGAEEGREEGTQEETTGKWVLAEHMGEAAVKGLAESTDYPYGYNAGAIEDEEVGQAILLTPGTSIVLEGTIFGEADLELEYGIHPWVAADSDGAVLNIAVITENNRQIYEYIAGGTMQNQTLSMKEFAGERVSIEISVSNKEGNSESCDWVILKRFAFSEGSFSGKEFEDGETTRFGIGQPESTYVRSATYFSDEWPLNFWNSEMASIDSDMEQIREDGFDSVILVIPWREFQPEISPVAYSGYAFQKLDQVMEAAGRAGLGVYARVGYIWDYCRDEEEDIKERFFRLMGEGAEREAWQAYMGRMYTALSAHDNFRAGFLVWEDFWYSLDICDETASEGWLKEDGRSMEELRLETAGDTGYQEWVEGHDTLEGYNQKYGTDYTAYSEIPIPGRTEPAMEAMYAFFDDFLNGLLADSQKEFPGLSMEVRMDWDVISTKDGEMKYYKHDGTYSCQDADFTAVMYGIPMGFENVGERVGFREAMEKTEYILGQLKQENGGKPVYIDQFVFADNTPLFPDNAQIKEDELDDYLENVHEILKKYSEGYGIWTYRNYRTNMLCNSQFALGGTGWDTNGNVNFDQEKASPACRLEQGGSIRQIVPAVRNHFDNSTYTLELDIVEVTAEGILAVTVGEECQLPEVREEGRICLTFPRNTSFDVTVEAKSCGVAIDNIRLYPYVHQGYLYDENNMELKCIESIRSLNVCLE